MFLLLQFDKLGFSGCVSQICLAKRRSCINPVRSILTCRGGACSSRYEQLKWSDAGGPRPSPTGKPKLLDKAFVAVALQLLKSKFENIQTRWAEKL